MSEYRFIIEKFLKTVLWEGLYFADEDIEVHEVVGLVPMTTLESSQAVSMAQASHP